VKIKKQNNRTLKQIKKTISTLNLINISICTLAMFFSLIKHQSIKNDIGHFITFFSLFFSLILLSTTILQIYHKKKKKIQDTENEISSIEAKERSKEEKGSRIKNIISILNCVSITIFLSSAIVSVINISQVNAKNNNITIPNIIDISAISVCLLASSAVLLNSIFNYKSQIKDQDPEKLKKAQYGLIHSSIICGALMLSMASKIFLLVENTQNISGENQALTPIRIALQTISAIILIALGINKLISISKSKNIDKNKTVPTIINEATIEKEADITANHDNADKLNLQKL